ncbi:hypothetical protein AB0J63_30815, partial [Streptosporangium canum]|uniref:hypothetical protein n=1 Tax=Streptosporangium canum TaxID=324952 RepID=UPI00343A517C
MTGVGQSIGVGEGETCRPGLRTGVAQLRQTLQSDDSGVFLVKVPAGAGLHDGELDLAHPVEALGLLGTDQIEGTLRTAEAALAVRHDRQERVGARHTTRRAQIAQRLGEVPRVIGGDADGLADHTDPGCEATGDLGVLVGLLCVALTEGTLGRHEMAGDQIGKVERERTQFLPDLLVEFLRRDVRSERGQFLTFPARSLVTAGRPVVSAVTGTGAFAFTAESAFAGTERPLATVVTVERRPPTTVVTVERGTLTAITRAVLATR